MADVARQPPGGFDQPCDAQWIRALLPRPPSDDDITVPGERILYKRRRHWLVLVRPVVRAAALVVIALQVVLGPQNIGPMAAALTIVAAVVLWRWARRHELWEVAAAVALPVLVTLVTPGLLGLWLVVVVQASAYLLLKVVEQRCYVFLYVTDRRLVATKGIVQRDVSTMPISRITDVRLRVTWFADWLGSLPFRWAETYGEFKVESAGQNQALGRLKYLLDPHWFAETVLLLATNPASVDDDGT